MNNSRKYIMYIALFVAILGLAAFVFRAELVGLVFRPTESTIPQGTNNRALVQAIATDLETPWGIAFLPNGDMLVTERSGSVKRVAEDETTYPIEGVTQTGEAGLLGIALHPQFADNKFVYLYSTYSQDRQLLNRVERYIYDKDQLMRDRTVIEGIPGSSTHDGGAIAFGPNDSKLYITTGDAGDASSAQDTSALSGKILRINDDGSIPNDNPFNNPVYSYGHRNPQGIAWDDKDRLWATEHGPSGTASGRDELNLIELGANYGWPTISGEETMEGMRTPIVQSGDADTWAPGGLAYLNGSLYFTGLRGQTLYQATINESEDNPTVSLKRYFVNQYGRLRAATTHEGSIYISTSNTDGRGTPQPNDDKILQIDPAGLTD